MKIIRASGSLFIFLLAIVGLSLAGMWLHHKRETTQAAPPPAESLARETTAELAGLPIRPAPDPTVAESETDTAIPSPVEDKGPAIPAGSAVAPTRADAATNNQNTDDVAPFVAMARNASIDANEREARIMKLGQQGDLRAARALMALGDEDTYLNFAAIHALAGNRQPEVASYLARKLNHGDPRMVAAAAASLAAVQGAAAVPSIAETLEANRLRADGQQDVVCAACVEALKQIGDASALPTLAAELDKTVGVSLSYDYGSRIISAIREIGAPSGLAILQSYADRLRALKAESADNPKAQHFFQSEIEKTTEAMAHLEKGKE